MQRFYLPVSILFAVFLIFGVYVYVAGSPLPNITLVSERAPNPEIIERNRPDFEVQAGRSESPWIKGDINAPIKIVTFSDFDCKYCRELHPTLDVLVLDNPGVVQWEFRQLPLIANLNARPAALAAECVGTLAGNDAFWHYAADLFARQHMLSDQLYISLASEHGISDTALTTCMQSDMIADRLLADEQIALTLDANGTPYSIIEFPDGFQRPVIGAVPLVDWEKLIIQ